MIHFWLIIASQVSSFLVQKVGPYAGGWVEDHCCDTSGLFLCNRKESLSVPYFKLNKKLTLFFRPTTFFLDNFKLSISQKSIVATEDQD